MTSREVVRVKSLSHSELVEEASKSIPTTTSTVKKHSSQQISPRRLMMSSRGASMSPRATAPVPEDAKGKTSSFKKAAVLSSSNTMAGKLNHSGGDGGDPAASSSVELLASSTLPATPRVRKTTRTREVATIEGIEFSPVSTLKAAVYSSLGPDAAANFKFKQIKSSSLDFRDDDDEDDNSLGLDRHNLQGQDLSSMAGPLLTSMVHNPGISMSGSRQILAGGGGSYSYIGGPREEVECQTDSPLLVTVGVQSRPIALEVSGRRNMSCQTMPQSADDIKNPDAFIREYLMRKDFEQRTATLEANAEVKRKELEKEISKMEVEHDKQLVEAMSRIKELEEVLEKRDRHFSSERDAFHAKKKHLHDEMRKMGEQIQSADSRILELTGQLSQAKRINALQESIIKKKTESETAAALSEVDGKFGKSKEGQRAMTAALAAKRRAEEELLTLEKNKEALQQQVQNLQEKRDIEELVSNSNTTGSGGVDRPSSASDGDRLAKPSSAAPKPPKRAGSSKRSGSAGGSGRDRSVSGGAKATFRSAAMAIASGATQKTSTGPQTSKDRSITGGAVQSPSSAGGDATVRSRRGSLSFDIPPAPADAKPSMGVAIGRGGSRQQLKSPASSTTHHEGGANNNSSSAYPSEAGSSYGDNHTHFTTGTSLDEFTEDVHSQHQQWEIYKKAVNNIEADEMVGALASQQLDTHKSMIAVVDKLVNTVQVFEQKSGVTQLRSVEERIREALNEAKKFYETQIQSFRDEVGEREKVLNDRWQSALSDAEKELEKKSMQLKDMHDEVQKLRAEADRAKAEKSLTVQEGAKLADTISELRAALLGVADAYDSNSKKKGLNTSTSPKSGGNLCALCRQETLDKELVLQYAFHRDRMAGEHSPSQEKLDISSSSAHVGPRWSTHPEYGVLLPSSSTSKTQSKGFYPDREYRFHNNSNSSSSGEKQGSSPSNFSGALTGVSLTPEKPPLAKVIGESTPVRPASSSRPLSASGRSAGIGLSGKTCGFKPPPSPAKPPSSV